MSESDAELLALATELLVRVYEPGRHEVAAAMRTSDGSTYVGVHVDGSARRSTVCAEGVAMGNAVAGSAPSGTRLQIEASVSVLRARSGTLHLIEPCGVCSELLTDYSPSARVWITEGDEVKAVTARQLLPAKRERVW
ncbi:cytidine deaminase [Lacisediminihabitans profunda]|uniref:Cytidine deaminase n=2 Tax=Lacisediminihabitans profunda TaxID=2594790 RepID=A0A5C8UQP4_9MICO|nr:cytidine deaminase [Lacisediminihabitans profunda]